MILLVSREQISFVFELHIRVRDRQLGMQHIVREAGQFRSYIIILSLTSSLCRSQQIAKRWMLPLIIMVLNNNASLVPAQVQRPRSAILDLQ